MMWGRLSRRRSPDNILDEALWLRREFGVEIVEFTHDHFTSHRAEVEAFCSALTDYRVDLKWICRARLNKVDADLLRQMKVAGCSEVIYGVESFSPETLQSMQKDLPAPERTPLRIKETADQGIVSHLSFIVGLPDETPEQLERTLEAILHVSTTTHGFAIPYLHLLCLLPGTGLWNHLKGKLELRRIPDFCEGVDFDDGRIPDEDWQLIRDEPFLFASFYNVRTDYIPIDTLYVIHRCFAHIVQKNVELLKGLLSLPDCRLVEFFQGLTAWFSGKIGDVGKLRTMDDLDLDRLIGEYVEKFRAQQFLESLSSCREP